MNTAHLRLTAKALMEKGKGILAADESNKSCFKRFEQIGIPCTETSRRDWRQLLFETPNINSYLSGVILFDETTRQKTPDGIPLLHILTKQGIIPGIKVDKGLIDLANLPGETITEGLDGLGERAEEYHTLGARFTKWRSAFKITNSTPSAACILANTESLARYAAICQEKNLVPIVEPEVLYSGHHSLEHCEQVIVQVLKSLFHYLEIHKVDLHSLILKSSFSLPGKDSAYTATPEDIARSTLRAFKASVPDEVAGIVLLSGGQTPQQATANLQALAELGPHPWKITFSYSRALQEPPLKAWRGERDNILIAQNLFLQRAYLNSLASLGQYNTELEGDYLTLNP